VLARHGIARVRRVRLVRYGGELLQQVVVDDGPARYFALDSGDELADGDRRYAEFLARHFLADQATPVAAVARLTAFIDEYVFVNRLLPVYRVRYATPQHDRYFVHLDSATLAAHVDDLDYLEGWTFAHLHKWQWLEAIGGRWPRDLLQIAFALMTAALVAFALRLFSRGK